MIQVVLQDGMKDCGVCSLLSVIRYYGGDVSKEYLRDITHTTKTGVSAYHLMEAAKKLGFCANGMRGDLSQIQEDNLPCLAHFIIHGKYKHFVVVYQINQKQQRVMIMDPAKGKVVYSFSEFRLLSSKNYIFLKPTKKLPIMTKKKVIRKRLQVFLHTHKLFCCILFLLTSTYFFLNIATAFHFQYLLKFSIEKEISENIFFFSYHLLIIYFFKEVNLFLRNLLLMKWIYLFDKEITLQTYEQILSLPYLYYKNRTTGEVISRFRDLTTVKNFVAKALCSLSTDVVSLIIFFFVMFRIYQRLTHLVLFFSFLFLCHFLLVKGKKRKLFRNIGKAEDQVNSYFVESLSGVDTIKGSHIEKRRTNEFFLHYQKLLENQYQYSFFEEGILLFRQCLYDILFVLIYGIGSYFVIEKEWSLGELFVFYTFLNYFLNSLNHILEIFHEYHAFSVCLERVEDLFTIRKEPLLEKNVLLPYQVNGTIQFFDFSYKIGTQFLFQNLNLEIKEGEKVLLTGISGSGKSSLMKILMRYLEVDYGNVSIGNIDINHYPLEKIRRDITYIGSQEYLFTDTLYHNITLKQEVSQEKFEKVIQITTVKEIIERESLKEQMMVEENGFNFSNGERQRIILARSLLKNSNIYIYDESFSQIDIQREHQILTQLLEYKKDATIIVISHRFNNQELFHRILKLENGQIYETKKL